MHEAHHTQHHNIPAQDYVASSTRKELAGRNYQFLPGHASIGSYLHDRIRKIESDECWWCDTGQRQSRFHLVVRCPAWAGQARVMWRVIERLCE